MKEITLENINAELNRLNYKQIETAHIVALRVPRKDNKVTNRFDDYIVLIVDDIMYGPWKCTTTPGLYYMQNPMNGKDACIMHEGQYINCFKRGYHKDYRAIQQRKSIKYYTDANKDGYYDLDESKTQIAMRYTNIHRANPNVESKIVEKWSAGCIVLANPKDFSDLMSLTLKRGDGENQDLYTLTILNWN